MRIPQTIKTMLYPVRKPYHLIRDRIRARRCTLRVFSGKLQNDGPSLKLAYAGRWDEHMHWLVQTVFGDSATIEMQRGIWLKNAAPAVNKCAAEHNCDISVAETITPVNDRQVPTADGQNQRWLLPFWCELAMGITDDDLKKWRDRYRKIRSRIRKHKLSYRMVKNDDAAFDHFFHRMYIPHIKTLYGESARTAPYHILKQIYEDNGELLFVTQDGLDIAGILIKQNEQTPTLFLHGILDANPEYVHASGISAPVFFAVEELRQRGVEYVNFGGSRPFLNDGALNFKRLFRAEIVEKTETRDEDFILTVNRDSPGAKAFLSTTPFAFWQDKPNMDWNMCVDKNDLNNPAELAQKIKNWRSPA